MTHEEIQDLLAPVAIGSASRDEEEGVRTHLAACAECRGLMAKMRGAAGALPLSVPPVRPPIQAKARLFARIRSARRPAWQKPLALAAGLAVCVGLSLLFVKKKEAPAPIILAGLRGDILVGGRAVSQGAVVPEGQKISISRDGRADLVLANRVAVRLSEGADAVITRARGGYKVDMDHGAVLSVVVSGTPYLVKTPQIETSALGTVFYVQTDSPEQTSVCICEGRILLEGPEFSLDLAGKRHTAVGIMDEGGKLTQAPHGVLAHDDKDIAELRELLK